MKKKLAFSAVPLALLFLSSLVCSQQSQDAMQLLKRVSQTYRGLSSYEIHGMMMEDQQLGEARDLAEIPLVMAEDKPAKIRIESKHPFMGGAEISDGKTSWEYTAMGHQYTKKAATIDADAPQENSLMPTNYVDRYRHLAEKAVEARVLREETLSFEGKDVLCQVVEVQFAPGLESKQSAGSAHTLWIAKESSLVLQEMWETQGDMMGVSTKTRNTVVYKTIRINQPVADALFTFIPPANAKEVDSLALPGAPRRAKTNQSSHEFSLSTIEGKKTSLSDFKGKTVLLDFWATWCVPCRESTPVIEKLHSTFKEKGLVTLAVDYGEEPDVVKGYLAHNPSALPNLVDPENTVANLYNVNSVPTFIVISKEGKVAYSSSGFGDDTETRLRAALKQEGFE